ncbi:MAG TPA: aminotransferase class I/II-fold pyridoxal phosphate-dependent enzyme [Thermomicrobiales bacterium]|nr:aminotransferase class I/II-fold pyridoxal phosphate-dependent enzyme [Thermomicrobiales bacterium]
MKIETFALERWMTTWELNVSHDITESGIAPMSIDDLLRIAEIDDPAGTIRELMAAPQLYSEARGTEALRGIIAGMFETASADDVLVTTGAIEANFLVYNALLEAGDHVVVTTPCYQQLISIPKAIGAEVSEWRVTPESGFTFDLDALDSLVTDRTKLIVINSPHNPTGAVLSQADAERIARIANRADAWVLSDEAYRWLTHPGGIELPGPFRDFYPKSVSVSTMSKFFGLPGLRLGWLVGTAELAAECWSMRDYVSLSPAWLSDRFSQIAVANYRKVQQRNHGILEKNLTKAREWFAENADIVSWSEPKAGLLAMMKVHGFENTDDLSEHLARDVGVMLAPGSAFGLPGYLRIGIGQRPEIFAEALDRTEEAIRAYKART